MSQIVDHTDSSRAKIAEADLRFDRAQERASQLIFGPERSIEAEDKSGREAREKLDEELNMARDHIPGLMSIIRSNSQELQMYRDRAKAQRQAGSMGFHYAAPMPFSPTRMRTPFPRRQAAFSPRPTQIPGFPPNRTSGFTGNAQGTLPLPGRGRGAGTGGGAGGGTKWGSGLEGGESSGRGFFFSCSFSWIFPSLPPNRTWRLTLYFLESCVTTFSFSPSLADSLPAITLESCN